MSTSDASPRPHAGSSPSGPAREPAPVTGAQRVIGRTLGRPRPRGRLGVGLAVLAALAIVLVPVALADLHGGAASGSATASGRSSPTPVSADGPLAQILTVSGRVGAVPVLSLRSPLRAASTVHADVLTQGQGRTVSTGDAVLLAVATFSGLTGQNTTGTHSGTRLYRGLLEDKVLGTDLAAALDGTTEGSRVVLRAPTASADGSATTEVTVVDVLPTRAGGEAREAPEGAPTVSLDERGGMSIDVTGTTPPTSSSASLLIAGEGPQVTATDRVLARYATTGWDGRLQSSTYGDTVVPGVIDMTSTLAGIAGSLVDVPVGSRVLARLTADQARGDEPVTVVIDVLGVAQDDQLAAATATPSGDVTSAPTADSVVVVTPRAHPSATAAPTGTPSAGASPSRR